MHLASFQIGARRATSRSCFPRRIRAGHGAADGDFFQFFSLNIALCLLVPTAGSCELPSMIFSGNLPSKLSRISFSSSSMPIRAPPC